MKTRVKKKDIRAFPRDKALRLAHRVSRASHVWGAIEAIKDAIEHLPQSGPGYTWYLWGKRVLDYLTGETDRPPLRVFMEGNSKLPFYCWSVLPIYNCPGKGECAKWCYSLTGWRNATPYWRQLLNTILLKFYPERVMDFFMDLPEGATLRLYVDGDFDSVETVNFWWKLLRVRPDIQAYGYSKSWDEIVQADPAPSNYILNLSSGGRVRQVTEEQMQQLDITRGKFVAVDIDPELMDPPDVRYQNPTYHQAVRQAGKDLGLGKVFSCKGLCGECVKDKEGKNAHACGDRRFFGLTIVNGKH